MGSLVVLTRSLFHPLWLAVIVALLVLHRRPSVRTMAVAAIPLVVVGAFLVKKTGRKMDLWPGACMVHETFSAQKIAALKARHPAAKFIAHPECEDHVLALADYVGSTEHIVKTIKEAPAGTRWLVGTELNLVDRLAKEVLP